MAMRSAMRRALGAQRLRRLRREHQRDAEHRALAGTGALRADVTAHAARQLACDGQAQPGAMGDAFAAAAAVVKIEELFGALGWETTTLVADVESPAPLVDTG